MFDHLESTYFLITFTFKGIHKRCLFFFKYLLLTSNGYYRKVQQIYNTYLLNRKNMHLSFKVYITFNYLEITYELLGSIKDFDVGFYISIQSIAKILLLVIFLCKLTQWRHLPAPSKMKEIALSESWTNACLCHSPPMCKHCSPSGYFTYRILLWKYGLNE